jgi:hypothetical protein
MWQPDIEGKSYDFGKIQRRRSSKRSFIEKPPFLRWKIAPVQNRAEAKFC